MLGRVLVEELAQRLPGTIVLAESGAISAAPDAIVEVNVLRLDADRDGTVVLRAQFGLARPPGNGTTLSRSAEIRAPARSPGIGGEVAAMSDAVAQLAEQIAAAVAASRRPGRMGSPTAADDPPPSLHECPGCGHFQLVPKLRGRMAARCTRCDAALRRGHDDPLGHATALAFAALVLMCVVASMTMMQVATAGISHAADLLAGPVELFARGLWELAAVVVFTTVVAPFLLLAGLLYMLLMLRLPQPPRHLRAVYRVVVWLAPWSMIEVFLLGSFVAYTKLQDLVSIEVGPALVALAALTLVMTWLNTVADQHLMWEALQHRGVVGPPPAATLPVLPAQPVGCHGCGLVQPAPQGHGHCRRCGAALHARKPNSIAGTWALCIAAAILYVPANYYPVLTVVQLGSGAPSTILGGVEELIEARMWPLAALVFTASIAVPMLKLAGLVFMLVCTQIGAGRWLRERTRLYWFVLKIGRWSMVDIFMESLLGALVQFGRVVTIDPGVGAVAFCGVVILTMIAAETFDPRLMWDSAAAARAPALQQGAGTTRQNTPLAP